MKYPRPADYWDDPTYVWTNGYFDVLHVGHLRGLQEAARLGDCLTVGVNAQTHKRGRPLINTLEDRMEMLRSLRCVDEVIAFDEETPCQVIADRQPDIICKGAEYEGLYLPEYEVINSYGGKMHFLQQHAGYSTSGLIERARSL